MIRLAGVGLHGGRACAVILSRGKGPTRLVVGDTAATLAELTVVRADNGVRVALGAGGPQVELVEHVLAAIGGLGLWRDVDIAVEGGEVPLLDGAARTFVDALRALEIPPSRPVLSVAKAFVIACGGARYSFSPAETTSADVAIDFSHPAIGKLGASWSGDAADFSTRIAPARTFGFLRDHAALVAAGRARAVDPASVVVFDDTGVAVGALVSDDEPARHKLLDLIGDLTLFGGPPRGHVHAERPGHAATHAAVGAALSRGALVVLPPSPR